jgi:hypothetical protein
MIADIPFPGHSPTRFRPKLLVQDRGLIYADKAEHHSGIKQAELTILLSKHRIGTELEPRQTRLQGDG